MAEPVCTACTTPFCAVRPAAILRGIEAAFEPAVSAAIGSAIGATGFAPTRVAHKPVGARQSADAQRARRATSCVVVYIVARGAEGDTLGVVMYESRCDNTFDRKSTLGGRDGF